MAIAAVFARSTQVVTWDLGERQEQLEKSANSLARILLEQWRAEERARKLDDPWPLPVAWAVTARAESLMANWSSIVGSSKAAPISLNGSIDTVSDIFRSPIAQQKMVILGEPGAGKSMIGVRLLLDLLERRSQNDPVPILLSPSSWNPEIESLHDWIAAEVVRRYPDLGITAEVVRGDRRSAARTLVGAGLIFPILDGLDEMPESSLGPAMEELATVVGRGRQLMLTCRTEEYAEVVAAVGPLPRTPVVELLPLKADDVVQYLVASTQQPDGRWDSVRAALGPDVQVDMSSLLSPLGVWLARTVYQNAKADPDVLVEVAHESGQLGVLTHLMAEFVPSAYQLRIDGYSRHGRKEVLQIQTWFQKSARELSRLGLNEITVENSFRLVPMPLIMWASVTIAGAVSASFIGLAGVLSSGFDIGARLALLNFLGMTSCAAIACLPWLPRYAGRNGGIAKWPARMVAATGAATWATGASLALTSNTLRPETNAIAIGIAGSVTTATLAWLFLKTIIFSPDPSKAINSIEFYRRRRQATFRTAILGGTSYGVWMGVIMAVDGQRLSSFLVGFLGGLASGATIVVAISWYGLFMITRLVLNGRGIFPIHILRFLEEAHRRGVLRQSGGVYEFRHALLQKALARQ